MAWVATTPSAVGRDVVTGNAGDDHLYGQTGGDTVIEGAGDDHDFAVAHGLHANLLTYEFVSKPVSMRLATSCAVVGATSDTVVGFDT